MIKTNVTNGKLSQKEIDTYISYGIKKYPKQPIKAIDIEVDGDYVNVTYQKSPIPAYKKNYDLVGRLIGLMTLRNQRLGIELSMI